MKDAQPYPNGRAVEQAIKEAARHETPRARARALEAAVRDRFLCRVFTGGSDRWALKGGTGMLARVPQARSTRDVDLFARESSIDEAVNELARVAGIDLGDQFRFALAGRKAISAGDQQPYVDGARVEFAVRIGAKDYPPLSVDLVVGPHATQPFETREPANRLILPRLHTVPYRLYAVVDQVADKVCAVLEIHANGPSSRQRDLVDLALLALTEVIDGRDLRVALMSEFARRSTRAPEQFTTPDSWGVRYRKDAADIDLLAHYRDVESARALVAKLIEPVLVSADHAGTWSPQRLQWHRT